MNPIVEREEIRNNTVYYYLSCSAPVSGENFHFNWYKNNERIFDTNPNFTIITEVEMNGTKTSQTLSHLKFNDSLLQFTVYTCSLVFTDQNSYMYSKNESYAYFPKCKNIFFSNTFIIRFKADEYQVSFKPYYNRTVAYKRILFHSCLSLMNEIHA